MSDQKDTVVIKQKINFETLLNAFLEGRVALMECYDTKLDQLVAVICVVNYDTTTKEYEFVPFASMVNENPYERFVPPKQGE